MTEDPVRVEQLGAGAHRIGLITLNAPERLNALNLTETQQLAAALDRLAADAAVACIVLAGSERAFCAGGDIRALYNAAIGKGDADYPERFFTTEYRLDIALHHCPKPVLAWGHGIVMGGGLGLFAGGSHRVVTESSRLAMPETGIALFPDVGAGWFLNQLAPPVGLFVGLTGIHLDAADALHLGLAHCALPADSFGYLLSQMQACEWSGEPAADSMRLSALLVAASGEHFVDTGSSAVDARSPALLELCNTDDVQEFVELLEQLAEEDEWFAAAEEKIRYASPAALCWTWKHLQRCRGIALKEVLQLDRSLALRVVSFPDFAEGVRALLIDKDRRPVWFYESVQAVPAAVIEAILKPVERFTSIDL